MTNTETAETLFNLAPARILSIALPKFHTMTGLSVEMRFKCSTEADAIELNLGFFPRSPSQAEFDILTNLIQHASTLIVNGEIMSNIQSSDNISNLIGRTQATIQKSLSSIFGAGDFGNMNIQPIDPSLVKQAQTLSNGVEIELNTPLDPKNE